MDKYKVVIVEINVAKTDSGYCAVCDILPGWIVAISGDLETLKKEVQESIDFYVECAKMDNAPYLPVFDGEYFLEYKFYASPYFP